MTTKIAVNPALVNDLLSDDTKLNHYFHIFWPIFNESLFHSPESNLQELLMNYELKPQNVLRLHI